ncbi:hypothetical protein ONS96_014832 [Cadophora gregata f. sp. sojae]|nr:hypothetical protein ONS96_014832 [Cadophora gregata f. sp. sojae]
MANTSPTPPTVPDRTFSSTLRRFFNVSEDDSDSNTVYAQNQGTSGNQNASASQSTVWAASSLTLNSDGREKEKGMIGMRRLGKAKSALNLHHTASSRRDNINPSSNPSALPSTNPSANTSTNNLLAKQLNALTPPSPSLSPQFLTHRRQSSNRLASSSSSASSPSSLSPSPTRPASPSSTAPNSPLSVSGSTTPKSPDIGNPNPAPKTRTTTKTQPNTTSSTNTSTPTPTFELTPLSTLIAQSYKDIEMLKSIYGPSSRRLHPPPLPPPTSSGKTKPKNKHNSKSKSEKGKKGEEGELNEKEMARVVGLERGMAIDFEKVEEGLRGFEEVYKVFLQTSNTTPRTEVHLLAMVCKRSEVVNGGLSVSGSGKGEGEKQGGGGGVGGVPSVKIADCCL